MNTRPSLRLASLVAVAARVACAALASLAATETLGAEPIVFNRDIRPILSENCFKCHGPDSKQRQAGLRLDRQEGATGTTESGKVAVVPGDTAASELFRRLTARDESQLMPPPASGKTLTPKQIELVRAWIEQGATWQGHWSFISPVRPPAPSVADSARVVNDIDRFVTSRLEREGLHPSAEADKLALLRRVTLDLTGLPPTPAEADAFLADTAPNAYQRVVDRLLTSPRFGEQQARYWLDLARYGDTHGLHFDNERVMWKYRDWVIAALNENMPFDRFVVEQLGGDLLPDATLQQRVATGFNRCNVSTSEGGSINEEVLVRYAVDRTETMAVVFMGLTLGCAVCHDHKFDPVSQKEFYQLFAFFNASADAAMDGNQAGPPPIVKVPDPEQSDRLARIAAEMPAIRKEIADQLAKIEYVEPPTTGNSPLASEPRAFVWIGDAAPAGAQLQGDSPWEFVGKPDHPVFQGEKSTRRKAAGLSQHFFTGATAPLTIGEGDKLFAHVYLDPHDPPQTVMLQFHDGSWEHRAYWGEDKIPFGAGGKENHVAAGPLPKPGEWVRLEVDAAAVGLKPGGLLNGWAFTQFGGTVYWDHAGIVTRTPQDGQGFESQSAWEAYERSLAKSTVPEEVRDAVKVEAAKRTPEQVKQIRDYFLEQIYPRSRETLAPLRAKIRALDQEREAIEQAIPVSMVMADLPTPRPTHVLVRGQYNKPAEKVEPAVPAAFPALPQGAPLNRLGLGRWLVDPSHPLTARVAVNRVWQQYFGRGIVKTSEDFGVQGEWPSHPELLDWLAVDFREHGWDVKRLHKLIVMSATYRQSSQVTPELLARDPENVLLARGPRFRLDAEVVRDSALFISGLMTEKVGGPSVKPYQPTGIWEAVGFLGSNTREYKRGSGEALHRRSMYTFWKRTAPPPSLMTFDAPSRENCVARRARTNTPLQALALMNDEQYVEAARRLAERMIAAGPESTHWLDHGFRAATGRPLSEREREVLGKLFARQLEHYEQHPEDALKLVSIGETKRDESIPPARLAAVTMMANLILNLDEVITKE